MPLKAVIESLENADESVRGLYAAGENELAGKFVLQVEASEGLQLAPVTKLQSALQAARAERDEASKMLKSFKDDEGNLVDISTLQNAAAQLEQLKKNGGGDEQIKALEDNLKAQYADREKQLATKFEEQSQGYEQRIGNLSGQLHSALLVSEATRAITGAGGEPEVLLPHIERHMKAVEYDEEGSSRIRYDVVDEKGQQRISTKPGSADPMSIDELVTELRGNKTFAGCFKAQSSGTGSGGQGSGNGDGGTISSSDDPVERMRAARRGA